MSASEPVRLLSRPRRSPVVPPPPDRRRTNVRRLLLSGLPAAMVKHVGPDADAYRAYLTPMLRLLGLWPVADFALDAAREAGRAMLDLRHLEADLEAVQARTGPGRRRALERSLAAQIRKARVSKRLCERDLARLAKQAKPLDLARAIQQAQTETEAP
jgi:hypothetical protein